MSWPENNELLTSWTRSISLTLAWHFRLKGRRMLQDRFSTLQLLHQWLRELEARSRCCQMKSQQNAAASLGQTYISCCPDPWSCKTKGDVFPSPLPMSHSTVVPGLGPLISWLVVSAPGPTLEQSLPLWCCPRVEMPIRWLVALTPGLYQGVVVFSTSRDAPVGSPGCVYEGGESCGSPLA